MAPPPPSGAEEAFLPVLTSDTDQAAPPARREDREPQGTPEEAQTILGGLPAGTLGQSIALPVPRIVHDFRLSVRLERKVALGKSCWGERNWIGICGGDWSATWGKGEIVVCFVHLLCNLLFLLLPPTPHYPLKPASRGLVL